jgi:hypothetical protein
MVKVARIILHEPTLTIEEIIDGNEKYYPGKSFLYKPYTARSNNAFGCLLKFNIQLQEQKRLSALLSIPNNSSLENNL